MGNLENTLPMLGRKSLPFVGDLVNIVQQFRTEKTLTHVLCLHSYICLHGLDCVGSLGNLLIVLFVEVMHPHLAENVFNKLVNPDPSYVNIIIQGYVNAGDFERALILYQRMQEVFFLQPNGYTYVALLQALTRLNDVSRGSKIHTDICKTRLLETDLFVGSSLVDMYAKCGMIQKANLVFEKLPIRNVVTWTSLIEGHVEHGNHDKAFLCFDLMQEERISPNRVTFLCILKSCTDMVLIEKGRELHSYITKKGLEQDFVVGSTLINMYVKFGILSDAENVFVRLLVCDVVVWNALIAGYAECECAEISLNYFEQMQYIRIPPDAVTFVSILKSCSSLSDLFKGHEIHADIAMKGLENNVFIGSALVDLYAKHHNLEEAQDVFDALPIRVLVTWNALIGGYVDHGFHEKALTSFQKMQNDAIHPDTITFHYILKACARLQNIHIGYKLHAEITRKGLEVELILGNHLIDLYARCFSLSDAQEVFDKLSSRNQVTWNTLIVAYSENNYADEVLRCINLMQQEGILPDAVTFVSGLKVCGSRGCIQEGFRFHLNITKIGLIEIDDWVVSTLVDMYVKCGLLIEAELIFDNLGYHDIVSWTSLISGYVEHGDYDKAFNYFNSVQHEGVSPIDITFMYLLKACTSTCERSKGQSLHADIVVLGLEKDLLLGNALIDMYSNCGLLSEAREVVNKFEVVDVIAWTTLMSGYVEYGYADEAIQLFECMPSMGISCGVITFITVLKACSIIACISKGHEIHIDIVKLGFDEDIFVGITLIDMYSKCNILEDAQVVFDKLHSHNAVSYNVMISAYATKGCTDIAISCAEEMFHEGISPDCTTFNYLLSIYGSIRAILKGYEIHAQMVKTGLLERDMFAGSSLVDMYARSGTITEAQEMFERLTNRDAVSWVAILAAYVEHDGCEEALRCFEKMQREGVPPNGVAFACILRACTNTRFLNHGQIFHADIVRKGFEGEITIASTLVDMYAKCAMLEEAQSAFEKLRIEECFMWNTLTESYGFSDNHVNIGPYKCMQRIGSMSNIVASCCGVNEVHSNVVKKGLEMNSGMGCTLIDMYAKYAMLDDAHKIFNTLNERDVASWTALMIGYGQIGDSQSVFRLLDVMDENGVASNSITVLGVLGACCHAGLVEEGNLYHQATMKCPGFVPIVEHYRSLIDLHARAGDLKMSQYIFEVMPFQPGSETCNTILGSCQRWGSLDVGRLAFKYSIECDVNGITAYICMGNIHACSVMDSVGNLSLLDWH